MEWSRCLELKVTRTRRLLRRQVDALGERCGGFHVSFEGTRVSEGGRKRKGLEGTAGSKENTCPGSPLGSVLLGT